MDFLVLFEIRGGGGGGQTITDIKHPGPDRVNVSVFVIHLNLSYIGAMYCKKLIILSNCVSVSEAKLIPMLAKYKLNVYVISSMFDMVRSL